MKVYVNPNETTLNITFTPEEAWELASVMELVFESEKKKKVLNMPEVDPNFFMDLALTKNKRTIAFGFGCMELGVLFLQDLNSMMFECQLDTTAVHRTLVQAYNLCGDSTVRH
ncbi:MAG: hypothetical protein WAZ40_00710 [Minisyncoccia bacterium]